MIALFVFLLAGPLPAHYAKLFTADATFTYDVSITTPENSEKHVVVCTVAKVATVGKATAARITCDKEVDPKFDIAAVYVAWDKGLIRFGTEMPVNDSDLEELTMLVAAKPRASRSVEIDKTYNPAHPIKRTKTVARVGGAWCTTNIVKSTMYSGTASICYGGGITSGSDDIGESHVKWKLRATGGQR